jgi:peptidyl-prolyl cis-trans isomerase C
MKTGAGQFNAGKDVAQINGVVICSVDESLGEEELRQRACSELLRQAAINGGLLSPADPEPIGGAMSEAASEAIENLLDAQLQAPEPDEDTCRRFYEGNTQRFSVGERVRARHVLFAVTPGVDVTELRKRAEACLIDLRCDSADGDDRFAAVAVQTSNCPSGAEGGHLGWLMESDCAPEFASELFGKADVGVLPRLVHSRFGLHVVEVIERQAGSVPTYEQARAAVAQALQRQQFATALRQYLQLLAGQATIIGIDLERSDSALVQ